MSKTLRSHAALPPRAVAEFFRLFAASGSVAFAADRTSLSRTVLYRRKRSDPAFAKRWAEAQELGVSKVRDEVFRRAVVGVKRPVFYGGAKIGKVRHFDNRLLWSLLKSHEPETYGPRRPQAIGGAPVDLAARLDEADERVAKYEAGLREAAKLKNS
ncbi:MAG: hypothetical protein WCK95_25740 [Alphaproteobacteria bacterium]